MSLDILYKCIKTIPDFPKPGIKFKNIAPLLRNVEAREIAMALLADLLRPLQADVIVGIDSRGFLFVPVADRLRLPFVMARKRGKLPGNVVTVEYDLEYGSTNLEIEVDSIKANQNVIIIDDLLATGGTIMAARRLVEMVGAHVVGACCLIDICIGGRQQLESVQVPVFCLLTPNINIAISTSIQDVVSVVKNVFHKKFPNVNLLVDLVKRTENPDQSLSSIKIESILVTRLHSLSVTHPNCDYLMSMERVSVDEDTRSMVLVVQYEGKIQKKCFSIGIGQDGIDSIQESLDLMIGSD